MMIGMLILRAWALIAFVMLLLWLRQTKTKNATSVDVAWSAGFGLVALASIPFASGNVNRAALVITMITLWSFRLAGYLYWNRCRGRSQEDGRYADLRKRWTQTEFFFFYQAQALLVALLAIPMFFAVTEASPSLGIRDYLGLAIWAIALLGETIADAQLAAHRADPASKGLTCRRGLWNYSRHPNYFFEWLHWWAYVAIGISAPAGFLTLTGPILMWIFFFKITGIPPTEAQALRSRKDYADYQKTTSVFIPWFPKRPEST